jgi:hypothetical protein
VKEFKEMYARLGVPDKLLLKAMVLILCLLAGYQTLCAVTPSPMAELDHQHTVRMESAIAKAKRADKAERVANKQILESFQLATDEVGDVYNRLRMGETKFSRSEIASLRGHLKVLIALHKTGHDMSRPIQLTIKAIKFLDYCNP